MWTRKTPPEIRKCKLPGIFSELRAPRGAVWECPRCGDEWVKVWNYITEFCEMEPRDPRSLKGCGSWSCDCDPPHTEQMYDTWGSDDPDTEPVEYPLLCMKHRKHLPCRRCE